MTRRALVTGAYAIGGDRITLTPSGDAATLSFTFYANDVAFAMVALLPEGDVDGVVGIWNSELTTDGTLSSNRLQLDSDGSASYSVLIDGNQLDIQTSYTVDGDTINFADSVEPLHIVDGNALSDQVFMRQR